MADKKKDPTTQNSDDIDIKEAIRRTYHRTSSGIDVEFPAAEVYADSTAMSDIGPVDNNAAGIDRKGSGDSGWSSPCNLTPKTSFESGSILSSVTPVVTRVSQEAMDNQRQVTDELKKLKLARSQSQGEIQVNKGLYQHRAEEHGRLETDLSPVPLPKKTVDALSKSSLTRAQTLPHKSVPTNTTKPTNEKKHSSIKKRLLGMSIRRRTKPKPISLTKENISDSESYKRKKQSNLRKSRSVDDLDVNEGYDVVQFTNPALTTRLPPEPAPRSAGFLIEHVDNDDETYETYHFDFNEKNVNKVKEGASEIRVHTTTGRSEQEGVYENVENVPLADEDERRYSEFGSETVRVEGKSEVGLPSSKVPTINITQSKQSTNKANKMDKKPIPKPRQNVPKHQQSATSPPLPAPSADENCQMALQAIQNIMAKNPQAKKTEIVIQTINFVAKYCDAHGGYLEVGSRKATLFIPPFALDDNAPVLIYIQIEESYCVIGGTQSYQIAPVIHCGIPGTQFQTPVILTFLTSIQNEEYFDVTGLRKETVGEYRNNASTAGDKSTSSSTTSSTDRIAPKAVRRETLQPGNEESTEWHETHEKDGKVISLENGKCTMMLHHFTNDTAMAKPKETYFGHIGVVAFTSPVMKKGNIFDIRVWMSSNQETLKADERRERYENRAKPLNDFSPTLSLFEDGGDVVIAITKLDGRWSIDSDCSKTETIYISKLRHDYGHQGIRESRVFRIRPAEEFQPNTTVRFDIELFQQQKKEFGIKLQVCVEPEAAPEGAATYRSGQTRPYRAIRQSTPWMPSKTSLERFTRSLSTNDNWKPLAAWLHLDVCHLEGFPNPASILLSMVYNKHAGQRRGDYMRCAFEEMDAALSTGKLGLGLREASNIVKEIIGEAPTLQAGGGEVVRQPTEEHWPTSLTEMIEVNEYQFVPCLNPYGYRTLQSFNGPYTAATMPVQFDSGPRTDIPQGAAGGIARTLVSTESTHSAEPVEQDWPDDQVEEQNRQENATGLVPRGLPQDLRRKSSGYCTIMDARIDPERPPADIPIHAKSSEQPYDQPYVVGGVRKDAMHNHLVDDAYDIVVNPLNARDDNSNDMPDVELSESKSWSELEQEVLQSNPHSHEYVNVKHASRPKEKGYLENVPYSKKQHKK